MRTLSKTLVELIERNADKLRKRVVEDIKKNPGTRTYHTLSEAKLYSMVFEVYSQFDAWMSNRTAKEDIKRNFTALGRQRREEGFALSEVIQALIIKRRRIWLLVDAESFLDLVCATNSGFQQHDSFVRVPGQSLPSTFLDR